MIGLFLERSFFWVKGSFFDSPVVEIRILGDTCHEECCITN